MLSVLRSPFFVRLFCIVVLVSSAGFRQPKSKSWIPADAAPELRELLQDFASLSEIYRKSGSEAAVREYILGIALENGYRDAEVDAAGNLKIFVPGTGEFAAFSPDRTIALQSHMDMVLDVENESSALAQEGFFKDRGIDLVLDQGWVHSEGYRTSIGADDGLGVISMIRYLRHKEIPHPPLDLVFTTYEEAGFVGAKGLSLPARVKALVNLDGGVYGTATLGGHGYRRLGMRYALRGDRARAGEERYRIELRGLHGGHSGLNGHDGWANAVNLLSRWVVALASDRALTRAQPRIFALDAGDSAYNKIPNSFSMGMALKPGHREEIQARLDSFRKEVEAETAGKEKDLVWTLVPDVARADGATALPAGVPLRELERLARRMIEIPFGVIEDPEYPASADLNSNLSFLHLNPSAGGGRDWELVVGIMPRFLLDSVGLRFTERAKEQFSSIPGCKGVPYYEESGPAWTPGTESELAKTYALALLRIDPGTEMKTEVSLGGLEPGQFAEKYPNLPMIALAAANIHDEHSRRERFEIGTLEKSIRVLDAYLFDLGIKDVSFALHPEQ